MLIVKKVYAVSNSYRITFLDLEKKITLVFKGKAKS